MLFILLFIQSIAAFAVEPIRLTPGYIYKLHCHGRLYVSAVGDDRLLRIEALPKEIGCGAVVKSSLTKGSTNLILETSTGTVFRQVEIDPTFGKPRKVDIVVSESEGEENER